MSEQEDKRNLVDVCERLQKLTAQINGFAASRRRRQRITAVVGVILAVSVAFSLSGLTKMTSRLDAEAIAQIGRHHIEARLPGARKKVQDYLEQEAPRIVGDTLRSMLASLPHVRQFLFKGLNSKLDELNFQFEQKTMATMTTIVQESKADVDAAFPGLSDREKLEKLVAAVSAKFVETLSEATTSLYPVYRDEMNRLISHLDHLEHTAPARLTEEEKIHKEIIHTLLQLLERRQEQLATEDPDK